MLLMRVSIVQYLTLHSITDNRRTLHRPIVTFTAHTHQRDQWIDQLQLSQLILHLGCLLTHLKHLLGLLILSSRRTLLLLVKPYYLLQGERAAYLVAQAKEVLRVILHELRSMAEQEPRLVIGRVIAHVLHRIEAELVVKALDEVVERCWRIFADQEHVPHL